MRWHALRNMHARARPTPRPAQQLGGVAAQKKEWEELSRVRKLGILIPVHVGRLATHKAKAVAL